MKPDRRRFLWACAGFAAARIVRGEEHDFVLQFSPETLDLNGPLGFAMVASAPCFCKAEIVYADTRSLSNRKTMEWTLEPEKAQSILTSRDVGGLVGVVLNVFPKSGKRPHLSGVIQTGPLAAGLAEGRPHLTGFVPSRESDKDRLERTAEKLPFVKDPAPRPDEGFFTVILRAESNLMLKIWKGQNESGPAIYQHAFRNLPAGENPVPWRPQDRRGLAVDAGEYLATLVATPTRTGMSDTLFFASVQVV